MSDRSDGSSISSGRPALKPSAYALRLASLTPSGLAVPSDPLSEPLSEPLSDPLSDPLSGPLSESLSEPLSKHLSKPRSVLRAWPSEALPHWKGRFPVVQWYAHVPSAQKSGEK